MNLDFQVHTFGCKVNSYDSGLLEKSLKGIGEKYEHRIHVLNTCAVTREATLEAGRLARRLKARDPFCLVVATGCAAQVDTEELERQSAIDLIVANSHKMSLPSILRNYYTGRKERVYKSNIFKKEDLEAGGGTDLKHTRAFLKVQDGCNSFCTFCVIPFARGKSRSLSIRDLVARTRELEAEGVQEVVLTGVHIGDYDDSGRAFSDLLQSLLRETNIPRFRISSLEPPELSAALLELFNDPRVCPHFHMSIQSAQSDVLKNMKRHYTATEVERALIAIHQANPEAFVGMDVIAGFPTETEDQHFETLERLRSLPWTRLHVFPYSSRPGTFAARWTPLPQEVVKARAEALRRLSDGRVQQKAADQIGRLKWVLPFRTKAANPLGLSRDFWTVESPRFSGFKEQKVLVTAARPLQSPLAPQLIATLAE